MKIVVSCNRCQGPVFLNRIVDSFGNRVVTLSCWNGHYHWIKIEDMEEPTSIRGKKSDLITYIGFFNSVPKKKS